MSTNDKQQKIQEDSKRDSDRMDIHDVYEPSREAYGKEYDVKNKRDDR